MNTQKPATQELSDTQLDSIADVVSMASAAPDGCQGVTYDVSVTLTGSQT